MGAERFAKTSVCLSEAGVESDGRAIVLDRLVELLSFAEIIPCGSKLSSRHR